MYPETPTPVGVGSQEYGVVTDMAQCFPSGQGGAPADFAFVVVFQYLGLFCLNLWLQMPFLGHAFLSALVYVWARRYPDANVSFFGLFKFPAPFLPYVNILVAIVTGASAKADIFAILVAHTYYYLADIYPPTHMGKEPLKQPVLLWRRLVAPILQMRQSHAPRNNLGGAAQSQVKVKAEKPRFTGKPRSVSPTRPPRGVRVKKEKQQ
ncbi:derlin [Kipferlia bialata]|uniref:Derlin n=1 Tax=Kipferlia bialata TaxID=797122 RepID=A0A9K3CNZ5_9EUKA|nr:derlin [Kipferlia bialata]|eukprot:g1631.t1